MIFTEQDLAADEQEGVNVTQERAGVFERWSAGWKAETIKTDAWFYSHKIRNDILGEIYPRLPRDAQERVADFTAKNMQDQEGLERMLFDEAGRVRSMADPVWDRIPKTSEELQEEINRRRLAELEEAEAVLGPGGGVAGFLGTMARAMSDPISVATVPFGGGGSVGRVVLKETALGALSEAAILPRENVVAEDLGLEKPNALARVGFGALGGGFLGGVIAGAPRAATYIKDKSAAAREALPSGANPMQHEAEVDAEYDRLLGYELENQRIARDTTRALQTAPTGNGEQPFSRSARSVEDVPISYELSGKIRNKPVSDSFLGDLRKIVAPLGDDIGVIITSGGQDPKGAPGARRTGSTRHDIDHSGHSHTADLVLTRKGRVVRPQEDKELYARFFHAAAGKFPGLGHYDWGVHVGGGSIAAWGPTTSSRSLDPVFRDAIEAGRVGWTDWQPPSNPKGVGFSPDRGPSFEGYQTRAGYTGTGRVTAGDGIHIDVEYEVVEANLLKQAGGDLQPRDRTRVSSDEQIAEIAASLDPARLMPSPEADRGTPIVGPDNIVESGNGRVRSIVRAAERHPDRYAAYKEQIASAGYDIPEGVERPVLIARRRSELDSEGRRKFVRRANTSAVARMSATERAASDAAAISRDTMALFDGARPVGAKANKPFVQRVLNALPQAERNALVDSKGALNSEGVQRLTQAMFARAYDAPDILARYAETGAGEFRSLIEALEEAAPAWAAMRADVASGRLRAEMDITHYVLDAMRLIANAREIARKEGTAAANVIEELLADVDLLEGALDPLTGALVRKFVKNGKAAPKDEITSFLNRYAEEARKVGSADAGLFGDAPGPADVLRALDERIFGHIEDIAPIIRDEPAEISLADMPEGAFAKGAASTEAIEADAIAREIVEEALDEGPFGPVFTGYADQPEQAIEKLLREKRGEVPDAFDHPELGKIGLIYGNEKMGLAHIVARRGVTHLAEIPSLLREGKVHEHFRAKDRVFLVKEGDPSFVSVIRLDWDGAEKTWMVTAYPDDLGEFNARDQQTSRRVDITEERTLSSNEQLRNNVTSGKIQVNPADDIRQQIAELRAQEAEHSIELPDGTKLDFAEILDDLEADENLNAVLSACKIGRAD